jgi:hypothetical protein
MNLFVRSVGELRELAPLRQTGFSSPETVNYGNMVTPKQVIKKKENKTSIKYSLI